MGVLTLGPVCIGHYGLVIMGDANLQGCNGSFACCDNYNATIGSSSCTDQYFCSGRSSAVLPDNS